MPCAVFGNATHRSAVDPSLLLASLGAVLAPVDVGTTQVHLADDAGRLDLTVVPLAPSKKNADPATLPTPMTAAALGPVLAAIRQERPQTMIIAMAGWRSKHKSPDATRQEQTDARAAIDAGADLVLGYGPPSLTILEHYNDRWIVYSTGDLAPAEPDAQHPYSAMLRVVGADAGPELRLYPVADGAPVDVFGMGHAFWLLVEPGRVVVDEGIKRYLRLGHDALGRFVTLLDGVAS